MIVIQYLEGEGDTKQIYNMICVFEKIDYTNYMYGN